MKYLANNDVLEVSVHGAGLLALVVIAIAVAVVLAVAAGK